MWVRALGVALVLAVELGSAHAEVTVYLDRDGDVTETGARIPPFGGGDRAWHATVACVRERYEPFAVDIVDARPQSGHFITAVVGGRASQLGLDDRVINGVGPYNGQVERDATVHVFSRVGTGEHDVANLCAVTAHEVAHALGLEHEVYCGDIMSYDRRCAAPTFRDVDAACGEWRARPCASGRRTQNSYRRLGELVGFRAPSPREPAPQDPYLAGGPDPDAAPPPPPSPPRRRVMVVRRHVRRYVVRVAPWY
jgi:hypothetical protein